MEDKQLHLSQTVQGIAGLVAIILGLLGHQVATEDLTNIGNLAIVAFGSVSALYLAARAFVGRLNANRNLKLGSKKL